MRRLIINADDLGADEARNEGIFEAIEAGVVTSASLLPNGPALGHALERIRSGGFERVMDLVEDAARGLLIDIRQRYRI